MKSSLPSIVTATPDTYALNAYLHSIIAKLAHTICGDASERKRHDMQCSVEFQHRCPRARAHTNEPGQQGGVAFRMLFSLRISKTCLENPTLQILFGSRDFPPRPTTSIVETIRFGVLCRWRRGLPLTKGLNWSTIFLPRLTFPWPYNMFAHMKTLSLWFFLIVL